MSEIKTRESRQRRRLAKLGLRLQKTPARSFLRYYYGSGYQILNDRNIVVSGCREREYMMTLNDVEAFRSTAAVPASGGGSVAT